jgi:hypothetical protein
MTKRMLFINIILSQVIILIIALLLGRLLVSDIGFRDLLKIELSVKTIITFLVGSAALLSLQLLFHKYVSKERLFDEINVILIEKFSLPNLFLVFFSGSFAEEFLFRGILQPLIGIWLTSLLFALIHFRYLRKFFILIEVYLMGIILGISYVISSSLWVPIFCHLFVNFITALLIKKGYLKYYNE